RGQSRARGLLGLAGRAGHRACRAADQAVSERRGRLNRRAAAGRMDTGTENRVNLGCVTGPFGVKGWIKVFSHTEPRENIVAFPSWTLVLDGELRQVEVEEGQRSGKYVVAKLKGIDDRGGAEGLTGAEIWVDRE